MSLWKAHRVVTQPSPPVLRVERPDRLGSGDQEVVLALVAAAERADGVAPLSEQSLLAVRGRTGRPPLHRLAYAGAHLGGYAQLVDGSAEVVVDPAWRRRGLGSALLQELPPTTRVWAHGDRPAAQGFARAHGLQAVRELWLLGRGAGDGTLPPAVLPPGLVARAFVPGQDEAEWLRVNAAAFADHPEQGRMTRADLDARMAEDWFDPAGLILVVPEEDSRSIAASHWTKTEPRTEPRIDHGAAPDGRRVGEVYVVAVDPAYQGQGLARPLTLLGLHHLYGQGCTDVVLYVDGDNPAALRVYRSLGFTTRSVDRMYARGA